MRFFSTPPIPAVVDTTDEAPPNPWISRGLPVPASLDPDALTGYVLEHEPNLVDLREALDEQLGEKDGQDTAETVENQVLHIRRVEQLRAELRRRLPELAREIRDVHGVLEELRGYELFDEEYLRFEGNEMVAALADAERQVTLAERLNPFRDRPQETSRRKVLREALISHEKKNGFLTTDPRLGIDMAALADVVAAKLGEFAVNATFADPYPRISGVALNEAGYAAAAAAGAQEPF